MCGKKKDTHEGNEKQGIEKRILSIQRLKMV